MSGNGIEIDLKELFKVLLKKLWIIALCAVLLGTSALVYTLNFVTPQYDASVSIYINNKSGANSEFVSSSDLAVALRLVASYVNIIQSEKVLGKVVEETGLLLTAEQVRSMVKAKPMGETEMLMVTVTTPNAQMSADIANAIARVAPAEITKIIEGSTAKIVDEAKVPRSPNSPKPALNAVLGAAVGAALVIGVILIQIATDTRIKKEEDLTKICGIPVLGSIPQLSADPSTVGTKTRR